MDKRKATDWRWSRLCFLLLLLAFLPGIGRANLYNFGRITNNSLDAGGNPVDGSSWFSVDIRSDAANQVTFEFFNNAPASPTLGYLAAIAQVYFYDGALIGSSVASWTGGETSSAPFVWFQEPDLPGSNLPGFNAPATKAYASADAEDPATQGLTGWGVHSGESLAITFQKNGLTLASVLGLLDTSGSSQRTAGTLQIGIHVQALPGFDESDDWGRGEASDAFVLTPVPGAVLLGMLGLGAAGWRLRRFA